MIKELWKKFKRSLSKSDAYNMYHADFDQKIEAAFVCNGITYYRFKKDYDMPVGRYKWVHNTLNEVNLRMTNEMLMGYIDQLMGILSGKKGKVDLTEAVIMLTKMKSHATLEFNIATVERLASVLYFDDTEILHTYDRDKGRKKIAEWRAANNVDPFLMKPIGELLKLKDFSINSFQEYVNWQRETFEVLTSEPLNQSPENS